MSFHARRARRLLRRSPRFIARRVAQEARRQLQRRILAQARREKGPLASRRLPASSVGAAERVSRNVLSLAPWADALAVTRARAALLEEVRGRAEQAKARELELFGRERIQAGIPPRWLEDARTGYGWPPGFAASIDFINAGRPSDVKLAWELSRLRHLVALAQAVALLDDDAALAALEGDLTDWIARNPVGWTVNWTVGMEVGLRAVNLICVDGVLEAAGRTWIGRRGLVESLYQHGWYLSRNLEVAEINGNHFLANSVGLLWLGRYFAGIGEAGAWFERGAAMAAEAAEEQILDDGLDHEGSLPYHFLVLEMMALAKVAGGDRLRGTLKTIERMTSAAEALLGPRSEVPDLGDDDGGRVAAFCDAPSRDGSRVIALAAGVLGRQPRLGKLLKWPQDALWLTGRVPEPVARPDKPARLPEGGVVVLGDEDDHVAVDFGPPGFRGRGGHGHLDAMSFVAWLAGRAVVRDSGTATYTGDPDLRNRLRGVAAHSTLMLDGRSYAQLGDRHELWLIRGGGRPAVITLEGDGKGQFLELAFGIPSGRGIARWVRVLRWRPGTLEWIDTVAAAAGTEVLQRTHLPVGASLTSRRVQATGVQYVIDAPADAAIGWAQVPWSDRYGWWGWAPCAEVRLIADGSPVRIAWTAELA